MTTAAAAGQANPDPGTAATTATGTATGDTTTDTQTPEQEAAADAATKTGEQAGAKPTGTDGAAAAAKKAPEAYTLTLPEGGHLDANDLKQIEAVARANDFTQEQAAAFLTARATEAKAEADSITTRLSTDQTYGGEKLEVTQRLARAALDKFLPKTTPLGAELREMFNKTGYGNYLPFVAFVAEVGRALGEDTVGSSQGGGGDTVPTEKKLYDHPASKALG